MTEGSKQPAKYTSDFNGLEKWFTHSIRRLKLSSELIHDITRDDRNPLKCISTRKNLEEFASECTDHSWEKAALDNFDSSGLSQVVVEIKTANGKQISFKKHQVEIDKETFNTAVEALIHLLRLISNLRHGFFSDKAYRSELYDEHKAEHGEEAADEFRYNYIRFHVDFLSEYGLNRETINKLKEVFELQKFGYLSAADEKGKLDSGSAKQEEKHQPEDTIYQSTYGIEDLRKWFGYPDHRVLKKYIAESGLFNHVGNERFNGKEVLELVKYMQGRRLTSNYRRVAERIEKEFSPKD